MHLSRDARIVSGITLLTVPTIAYGGLVLLMFLVGDDSGFSPPDIELNETQRALFRAGHAHAGVWVIFALLLQVLLDAATLSTGLRWIARLSAPLAALATSGGFFGMAFDSRFRWLLYFGGACLMVSVLLTGIGLLRRPASEVRS